MDGCLVLFVTIYLLINYLLVIMSSICSFYNYAGDNTGLCFDNDISEIKAKLGLLSNILWFKHNGMSVNPDKCQ